MSNILCLLSVHYSDTNIKIIKHLLHPYSTPKRYQHLHISRLYRTFVQ